MYFSTLNEAYGEDFPGNLGGANGIDGMYVKKVEPPTEHKKTCGCQCKGHYNGYQETNTLLLLIIFLMLLFKK